MNTLLADSTRTNRSYVYVNQYQSENSQVGLGIGLVLGLVLLLDHHGCWPAGSLGDCS